MRASVLFDTFSIMRFRDRLLFRQCFALCALFVAIFLGHAQSTDHPDRAAQRPAQKIGRPVRVVSLSFNSKSLAVIADVVDREGAKGVDLIILPETWRGQEDSPESLDGPTVTTMAALAKKHSTYLVCPIDRRDGTHRLNTAVLIDRAGSISGVYDKVYPYWSEFDHQATGRAGPRGESVSN